MPLNKLKLLHSVHLLCSYFQSLSSANPPQDRESSSSDESDNGMKPSKVNVLKLIESFNVTFCVDTLTLWVTNKKNIHRKLVSVQQLEQIMDAAVTTEKLLHPTTAYNALKTVYFIPRRYCMTLHAKVMTAHSLLPTTEDRTVPEPPLQTKRLTASKIAETEHVLMIDCTQIKVLDPAATCTTNLPDTKRQKATTRAMKKEHCYSTVLTCMDCRSRFVWAFPLRSKAGPVVAQALYTLMMTTAMRWNIVWSFPSSKNFHNKLLKIRKFIVDKFLDIIIIPISLPKASSRKLNTLFTST